MASSYKIFDRYKESGLEALTDRSRRPWDRHGLVQRRGRKRNHAQGTPLSLGQKPNELWCTDYKGEFLLGNKKYCYPLTVTDHASRYLLLFEALESTCESLVGSGKFRSAANPGILDDNRQSGSNSVTSGYSVIREGSAAPAPGLSRIPIVRDGVRNFNSSSQLLELAPDRASYRTEMPPISRVS